MSATISATILTRFTPNSCVCSYCDLPPLPYRCISRQLWWGHRIPVWYVYDSEDDISPGGSERFIVAHDEAEARKMADEQYGASSVIVQVRFHVFMGVPAAEYPDMHG